MYIEETFRSIVIGYRKFMYTIGVFLLTNIQTNVRSVSTILDVYFGGVVRETTVATDIQYAPESPLSYIRQLISLFIVLFMFYGYIYFILFIALVARCLTYIQNWIDYAKNTVFSTIGIKS